MSSLHLVRLVLVLLLVFYYYYHHHYYFVAVTAFYCTETSFGVTLKKTMNSCFFKLTEGEKRVEICSTYLCQLIGEEECTGCV